MPILHNLEIGIGLLATVGQEVSRLMVHWTVETKSLSQRYFQVIQSVVDEILNLYGVYSLSTFIGVQSCGASLPRIRACRI